MAAPSFPRTLGMQFAAEPPGMVSTFTPRPEHRGPPGVLHGGLAATVLDATMAALGLVMDQVHSITATLELKYRHPVPIDGHPIRCEAWRDHPEPRRAQRVHGHIVLADGTVAVEATGLFVQSHR